MKLMKRGMRGTFIISTEHRSMIPSRSARKARAGLDKSRGKNIRWGTEQGRTNDSLRSERGS